MVFFRVDSNPIIASGHIMRCLSLAQTCIDKGIEVCFLIADHNPIDVLSDAKIPYIELNSDWRDLTKEIPTVVDIISTSNKTSSNIIIIDTYSVTKEYIEALKPFAKVGYLGSKKEYLGNVDFIINYSLDIDYDFYKMLYPNTELLLGPKYSPLRKEFFLNKKTSISQSITNVLITTGNTEKDNFIARLVNAIYGDHFLSKLKLKIIIGNMFTDIDSLKRIDQNFSNVELLFGVTEMAKVMKSCDIAISACGTTVYELCVVGVPTISFAMTEEQIKSAEALEKFGAIDYCGRLFDNSDQVINKITNRLLFYIRNINEMEKLFINGRKLIDGNGNEKIVNYLKTILY